MAVTTSFFGVDALEPGDFVCRVTDASGVVVVQKALAAVVGVYGVPYGMATQASSAGGAAVIATDGLHATSIHGLTGGPSKCRLNTTTGRAEKVASYVSGDIPVGNLNAQNFLALLPSAAVAPSVVSGIASVAGSGQISVTGAGDKTVSSAALDRLHANELTAQAALANADATLTVAGGKRYRLPDNTLTEPRTLTLSTTGAVIGDTITIVSEQKGSTTVPAHNALVVRNATSSGTVILNVQSPGAYVAEFDGTAWKGKTPAGMQVFNVKDYGAIGDERITVFNPAAEAAAIQACIDAAARCARDTARDGAVVYFPPGHYRTDGVPLIHRRTPYDAPLMFMGAGAKASTIENTTGVGPLGDVFRAETLAENAADQGGEQHTFQDLAFVAKHYAYVWDFGDSLVPGVHDSIRLAPRFVRCFFSRTGTPGPAVRMRIPSRATFLDCIFDPNNIAPGIIGAEIVRGSGAMIRCRGGGAICRFRDSTEIMMIGCRCEGAQAIPGWDFYNCVHVTIQNATNEGNDEADAVFRFVECDDVVCDSLSPAVARPYVKLRANKSLTGAPTLTFSNTAATELAVAENKIVRSSGSWFEDRIGYGGKFKCTNAVTNTARYTIIEATHDTLWVAETLSAETKIGATGDATYAVGQFDPSQLPDITFDGTAKTITRVSGSWIDDGFAVDMSITTDATLNGAVDPFVITGVTDLVLTCTGSGIVNEGPVKKNVEGGYFAAGTALRKCKGFHIRNQYQGGSFYGFAVGTAFKKYGIEVDANCRDGVIENSHTGAESDISINASAYNVVGQSHGHGATLQTWWHGRQRAVGLDVEENLLHLRVGATVAPSAFSGLSVRRDASGFQGLWWDEATSAWYLGSSTNETSVGVLARLCAADYVAGTGQNTQITARSGVATLFRGTASTLGDTNVASLALVGTDALMTVPRPFEVTITGTGIFGSSTEARLRAGGNYGVIVETTQGTLYGGGVNRIRWDGTGLGFYGTAPIAKPTGVAVTAAAIHAALVSLGLITA